MIKNICTVIGIIYAIASGGAGGWWYFAANEARHQLFDSLLSNTSSDTQRIIDNQTAFAEKLLKRIDTLTDKISRHQDDMTSLLNTKFSEFRDGVDSSGLMSDTDKQELKDKLVVIESAVKKTEKMSKEHKDRKRTLDRFTDSRTMIAMGLALAFCAFARLNEPSMSEALPQMVSIVAMWILYCVIIPGERIDIGLVCIALLTFSAFAIVGVKVWKVHGAAIRLAMRNAVAESNERRPAVATAIRESEPVEDLVKLQAEAKARRELFAEMSRKDDEARALLRDAEIARGYAPPPYPGSENRFAVRAHTGHSQMRHTSYEPEYPQFRDRHGQTFIPRSYPQ